MDVLNLGNSASRRRTTLCGHDVADVGNGVIVFKAAKRLIATFSHF